MQVTEDEIEKLNELRKRKKNACTGLKLAAQAAPNVKSDTKNKREKREISIHVTTLDNKVLQ